jgi:hypothetical protein
MVARILLTGGRAPATLESGPYFECRRPCGLYGRKPASSSGAAFAAAIARNYQVPAADRAPDAYIQALCAILCREKIESALAHL